MRLVNKVREKFMSKQVCKHPYAPFDFNFYIDTDISFPQTYHRQEEFEDRLALDRREIFKYTPYIRGLCNICGLQSAFFCKNLIHPRDFLTCMHCGSTSRYRSVARGVLRALSELSGVHVASMAAVQYVQFPRIIKVYDTQVAFSLGVVTYPLPHYLAQNPNIELFLSDLNSVTNDKGPNGEYISQQNLESLSYDSNKFDIVITSDVMEHVRQPQRAHGEIARVVRPGGVYIFTVPHTRDQYETQCRVKINNPADPSQDEYLEEKVYHGDPNSGDAALVYQIFGRDIDDQLNALGFDVSYCNEDFLGCGILGSELFYCRKRVTAV